MIVGEDGDGTQEEEQQQFQERQNVNDLRLSVLLWFGWQ